MGKPAVVKIISRYYRDVLRDDDIDVSAIEMREFAFMFRNNVMLRHRWFRDVKLLRSYLARYVPYRVFHSAALYKDPGNQDMEAKGWVMADFVIDVDSDKLVEERRCFSYEECMSMSMSYSFEMADYIEEVFGGRCEVHFSGRRGFHVVCSGPLSVADREGRIKAVDYMMTGHRFSCTVGDVIVSHEVRRCEALVKLGKAFDRNVTIDTSRLIGCVGTIHGGSCLKVVKIPRDVSDVWKVVEMAKWIKGEMKVKVTELSTPLDIFQFKPGVQTLDGHTACYALAVNKAVPFLT